MRRLLLITAFFSLCFTQQTYDSEIQPIWDANCTRCHGSSGNLDLSQGVSYSNIVNVASSGYSSFLLVEPNNPMNSVMHQKIVGNSAFGERMPKNASKLSTSDENKIKTWIDNGALKDWTGGKPNTLEIVVRLNENIGNGDVHVDVWLPGNTGNPDITDNNDNLTSPAPTEGWGFELTDSRITPNNGPYSVEVFFDKNNNKTRDANEAYAIFDLNTDNQGYAFQDIEMFKDKLEIIAVVPNKFELAQNIPNPFNPVTKIRISLKEDATISLKVFNLLGKEINSMAMNQPMSKGTHSFIWSGKSDNGQSLPSGVYLYRLEVLSNNDSPVYQNTKKMMLMK